MNSMKEIIDAYDELLERAIEAAKAPPASKDVHEESARLSYGDEWITLSWQEQRGDYYDGYSEMDTESCDISHEVMLMTPEVFKKMVKASEKRAKEEESARTEQWMKAYEMSERATYEKLKAKFEKG